MVILNKTPFLICVTLVALSGCGDVEIFGKKYGGGKVVDPGPDEFSVLPTKPLEIPTDVVTLPAPTLGSKNRADLTPAVDAVVALGGRAEALESKKIGSGEQALLNSATRLGVSPDIRAVTTKEDAAFRAKRKPLLFERLFKTNVYLKRYEKDTLNARRELERLRRMGVRTPTAPPAN